MGAKYYTIAGRAYTDMLKTSTGKALTTISAELGYNATYLRKMALENNKIRIAVANQIEALYGIPISPYIVKEQKEEPKKDTDTIVTVGMEEFLQMIRIAIETFLREKSQLEKET